MFTTLLDTLLFFTVTTPLIDLLTHKIGKIVSILKVSKTGNTPLNLLTHRAVRTWAVGIYAMLGFLVPLILLPVLYYEVLTEGIIVISLALPPLPPTMVCLEIDALSLFMTTIFLFTGFMASIHSMRYMEGERGLFGYHTLLLSITAGMVGVAFAGDLFTLFIFWEVVCVSSYALVAFRKRQWESIAAGYKYLIMSSAGSVTMLFAISLLYGMTGTLNLAYLSASISKAGGPWILLTLALFIAGFGIQMGMAPLHAWLPDAHSAAPAPISAVLSGAMVKIGVYGLIRVLFLLFPQTHGVWQPSLATLATLTMFTGNLMALLQDDVKRLLAFSTIANIGYILLGLATGSLLGLTGSIFHILNHALCKSLLFLCIGSFVHQAKTRKIEELVGIGRTMRLTGAFFTVGALATLGVPPFNSFWSEMMIVVEGMESGIHVFSILMAVNIALSAFYFLRMVQVIMFQEPTLTSKIETKTPVSMLAPTLILASLCIIIGFYPSLFRSAAEWAAHAAFNLQEYVNVIIRG